MLDLCYNYTFNGPVINLELMNMASISKVFLLTSQGQTPCDESHLVLTKLLFVFLSSRVCNISL